MSGLAAVGGGTAPPSAGQQYQVGVLIQGTSPQWQRAWRLTTTPAAGGVHLGVTGHAGWFIELLVNPELVGDAQTNWGLAGLALARDPNGGYRLERDVANQTRLVNVSFAGSLIEGLTGRLRQDGDHLEFTDTQNPQAQGAAYPSPIEQPTVTGLLGLPAPGVSTPTRGLLRRLLGWLW